MKFGSYVVRGLLAGAALACVLAGAAVLNSKVELTEHGVHKRLLVPLGPLGKAGVPLYAGTGDKPVLPGFMDGPAVRIDSAGAWTATWFCEDRAVRRSGTSPELSIDCGSRRFDYALGQPLAAAPAEIDMPAKLLVLSDIEGNSPFLDAALRELGVVDEAGAWHFGANRLVIAGDAVDRGRDVFAVLWRLHALDRQARAAGGGVHLLLGNHEQYLLRGNTSRAHTEHLYALAQIGGQQQAFASDTVLGRWLREQPVIMRAGKVILTHGGISPEVAASGLSVRQLNNAMGAYWRGEPATAAALDAVIGTAGVTQYRGYFEDAGERYRKATRQDIDAVLAAFDATSIVVGHTLVERITSLYDGRLYAVDVNSNTAASEALLFVNGTATVVPLKAGRALPEQGRARSTRPLDLLHADDRQMILSAARRSYEMSRLPHPY